MVEYYVPWIGLLCNVDSSILSLELPNGFEVRYFDEEQALELFRNLGTVSNQGEFVTQFGEYFNCISLDDNRIYYVFREEKVHIEPDTEGRITRFPTGETLHLYHDNIRKIIRLLRLFKDGDVRIPYHFQYYEHSGRRGIIAHTSHWHISNEKFTLKTDELESLYELLKVDFPFKKSFLQLAFENYEDSYEAQHPILSFLSLMISLEILLNPADRELRYRISRNCAVLLGNDFKESREIFKEIKELYDVRSKVIHTGDSSIFNSNYLPILRHYIRESIKKMIQIGESKDKILIKLNTLGFGEIHSLTDSG